MLFFKGSLAIPLHITVVASAHGVIVIGAFWDPSSGPQCVVPQTSSQDDFNSLDAFVFILSFMSDLLVWQVDPPSLLLQTFQCHYWTVRDEVRFWGLHIGFQDHALYFYHSRCFSMSCNPISGSDGVVRIIQLYKSGCRPSKGSDLKLGWQPFIEICIDVFSAYSPCWLTSFLVVGECQHFCNFHRSVVFACG